MIQTTMEQTLSNGWPKRFMIRLTAYDITRVWEVGTRFILSLLTLTIRFFCPPTWKWPFGRYWSTH